MESVKIRNRGEDIVSVLKRTDTIIFDIGNVLLAYDWRSYLQEFDFSPEVFRIIAEAVFLKTGKGAIRAGLLPGSGKSFFWKMLRDMRRKSGRFLTDFPIRSVLFPIQRN